MISKKFGRLTVLEELAERKHGTKVYKCQCDCGNIVDVRKDMLKSGNTKSCGCLQREKASTTAKNKRIHGKSKTRLYGIYHHIINRCCNKNVLNYSNYGGRGITICEEWLNDFMAFYNWSISNGYNDNLTIDRIDVNGNYEPSNCRWVTPKQQSNNRRSSILLNYNGEIKTIKQWSEKLSCKYGTMVARYHAGWSTKDVLFGKEGR